MALKSAMICIVNFDIKEKSLVELAAFEADMKKEVNKLYNTYNLEIIKLFKLLLNFGLYEDKHKHEFVNVLKPLFKIFEFEKYYPEGQILLDGCRNSIFIYF